MASSSHATPAGSSRTGRTMRHSTGFPPTIYELPTRWSRIEAEGTVSIGGGTFRDVLALVDRTAPPSNFAGVAALAVGEAHLEDLGVNALELLPPADSFVDREWGYATSNYFAAD